MLWIPRKLDSFSGVIAGGTAKTRITGGPTLGQIIVHTSLAAAEIVRASLVLNGDPIVQLSGVQMDMLEAYKKRYKTAGDFVIPLADFTMSNIENQAVSGLVTFPTDNLFLEIEIAEGVAGAITLEAEADYGASQSVRQYLPRIKTTNIDASGTTDNKYDQLNDGTSYRRLHLAAADIGKLKVLRGVRGQQARLTEFERSKAAWNTSDLKRRNLAPQTGWYHVDFVRSRFGIADLMTLKKGEVAELLFDKTAAGNIPVLVESIENVTGAA